MSWTARQLAEAMSGTLVRDSSKSIAGIETDTRKEVAGCAFVALEGPNFDGHDFVPAAVDRGAAAAVVAREIAPIGDDVGWIRVGDTLRAYGDAARSWRCRFPVRLIAITGSNGKTTTRSMIASILRQTGARVLETEGNENNLVGLPRTLLRLAGDESWAVIEMGMNQPGEIARLTEIAVPEVGVLTNVAPAHLERLGTIDDVARAKGELARGLRRDATLVINGDDERLRRIAASFPGRTVAAGESGAVRVVRTTPRDDGRLAVELDVNGVVIEPLLPIPGAHNATNAAVAAACAASVGIEPDVIRRGLELFPPQKMRLERVRLASGAVLLNDAYNANPASMAAAIAALAAEPAARRIAVLGEMGELGPDAAKWHRETGAAAARANLDRLVVVGRFGEETARGAREAGMPGECVTLCETPAEAVGELGDESWDGSVMLVKGSRSARMERIVVEMMRNAERARI